MGCVRSVSFSVVVNGQLGKTFNPSKGIRKGDPLSSYLFLFVSEALSHMIQKAVDTNYLQGLKISKQGLTLSHLLFADDYLFFLKATYSNSHNMMHLLNAYCTTFGQNISMAKFSIFLGQNTPLGLRRNICSIFGIRLVEDPGKYLGLPTSWGHVKGETVSYIKDHIHQKLQGWKQSVLSQTGLEIMIKAVALVIPTYPINVFKLPTSLCREIDALLAKFWWGQKEDETKVHWVSWKSLGI
ncbi:unnamed protein product, partial [Prunus brigantina]